MDRNKKEAGSSLGSLISALNSRIVELQDFVIAHGSNIPNMSAVDTIVKAMEYQMLAIKDRLREEMAAIPQAKEMTTYVQPSLPLKAEDEPVALPKVKRGRGLAPRWRITVEDLTHCHLECIFL